jgi:hypothetical protein
VRTWFAATRDAILVVDGTFLQRSHSSASTGERSYVEVYGDKAWRAPDGTIYRSGADPNADPIIPGPLAVRFTGPVYLLIGLPPVWWTLS